MRTGNFKLKISTVEESINIENHFKDFFEKNGLSIFKGEGVSINRNGYNLFERFESDEVTMDKIISIFGSYPLKEATWYLIKMIFTAGLYPKEHYDFIIKLLKSYDINYNIIIHTKECSGFLWIRMNLFKATKISYKTFNSCKELANEMYAITEKLQAKPFYSKNKLKCIDICLRENRTPYAGNFDGIVYSKGDLTPNMIVEFSKVDWVYKIDKDIHYHISWYCKDNSKGWREDINRWRVLRDLGKKLTIPIYIIWWGTQEDNFAIGELREIKNRCKDSIFNIKTISLKNLPSIVPIF